MEGGRERRREGRGGVGSGLCGVENNKEVKGGGGNETFEEFFFSSDFFIYWLWSGIDGL